MNDFTILYVEDNILTQKIVKSVLTRYFKKIFVASDGVEGIKLYQENTPDIVLTDISMPHMNGLEMSREIKRFNPNQRIALFTGYSDIEYLKKAINMGIDKYILKPLESQQMFEALEDIVNSLKIEREQKSHKKSLEFASQHDELTGLANRRLFFSLLEKLIHRSVREDRSVALLAIDLNKFKPINDTYGHEAGDIILKQVAKNLLKSIRKGDIVARFGGDEFAVAIGFLREHNHILNFLKRVEKNFLAPVVYIDDDDIEHTIPISFSIGITFHSPESNAITPEALLRQADRAMYSAKESKKPYRFFDADEESKFKIKAQKSKEIKRAIDRGEFLLYYQPVIDIKSGKIVAFESLIRWNHPQSGILTPDNFLPYILDNSEIICHLGKWVIGSVFAQYERWIADGYDFLLSINISSNEFESKEFLFMLKTLLEQYPSVRPNRIVLEIVENIAIKDIDLDESALGEVKKLGFKIALDNFGTGFSTLSSIKRFNVDIIKIDKSFVMSMLKDRGDHSMVDASIQLAKAFGYRVVAEGVESREHLPALLKLGCDSAQGYGIALPMPSNEVELFYDEYMIKA
ncbi:diguanylate cyclase/phosphodiesterase (GGDEF & EAL domains) with PAS/PAC sensor(s) [hydrothermal vent metagenome]|uniref:Diguanylate cyclase/phosphodiesterase (GGDEF & EAL domains) with PAS/PAC sensor(S) n=1 Tax=hydrothermal vent metagenome TaxID=652676 RepID=A0A1W1B9W0_9ZZZZ